MNPRADEGERSNAGAPPLGARSRVFFACWPPPQVASRLADQARALGRASGARAMRADTLHLTLAFLGELDAGGIARASATARTLRGMRSVLVLDELAFWKHNRIIYAGTRCCPAELRDLAEALREGLRGAGFRVEARPFAVHVTLLRKAGPPETRELTGVPDWPIEEFVLVRSVRSDAGARYEPLARFKLSAA